MESIESNSLINPYRKQIFNKTAGRRRANAENAVISMLDPRDPHQRATRSCGSGDLRLGADGADELGAAAAAGVGDVLECALRRIR
jgi:hypothetical protein